MDQFESYPEDKALKSVKNLQNLLTRNDQEADEVRQRLDVGKIFGINIMGSPGSGKTTLLEALIDNYNGKLSELAVLEGDLDTTRDADRIRNKGVAAHQICTGSVCHLSAAMITTALDKFPLQGVQTLFIENVGNLVCPSKFSLGTHLNVVTISIPEGDDKPIKYPVMIRSTDLVIFTKTDLLPHFDFDLQRCRQEIKELNPQAIILETAATTDSDIKTVWKHFFRLRP